MKGKFIFYCCFALVIELFAFTSYGQQSEKTNTKSIYLHTDRAYYAPGESVFFKAYISDNQPNSSDRIIDTLHVALIDDEGIEVTNDDFPLGNSLFSANISLPQDLSEGSYMLIASTNIINDFSPVGVFSKIIEIQDPESELSVDLSLTDSIYKPGSLLTAQVRIRGADKPVNFNYQLTGPSGELLSGKGKTNSDETAIINLKLPEFDLHQPLKLLIKPLYKGAKKVTGIVIPSNPDEQSAHSAAPSNNHLKIQVSSLQKVYLPGDKVQLAISVTDEKGHPVMANLSVSVSNLIPFQFPVDYNNMTEYKNYKATQPAIDFVPAKTDEKDAIAVFNTEIRNYFAQCLSRFTESPGKTFIVRDKSSMGKAGKKQKAATRQSGYSPERSIMDIIMQIKPYHIENGKITFGISSLNSINNLDGALIVVDGIKYGTDVAILSTLPVQDIARITVSTNAMDIQRYSGMNNVGVIEITMKKSNGFVQNQKSVSKGNTLYWEPDLIIDNSGRKVIDFLNTDKPGEVIITINGIAGSGIYGSASLLYSVAH